MSKLKANLQRLVQFFLASLFVVGSLPLNIINSYAADAPTNDAPAHQKTLTPNGDGTYTIGLSVTGSRESSETTSASKANVVLVVDTSNSMNGSSGETNASGQPISRIAAEKDALTKDDGIIDKLLAQNVPGDSVRSDIIEVAVVNFGTEGHTAQTWTTNGTTLKNTINGLTTSTGTNWEGALQIAKDLADAKKQAQPNEDIYVIFLTDGEPTTDETRARNNHIVNTKYDEEWGYASDDARAIVSAGYTFYGLFTWGSSSNSSGFSQPPSAFLKSLVQYAYTGTGSYNSSLSSDYAEYYTNASSTTSLINALNQIVHNITTGVGYTNVELEDGVTAMTASSVKASAGGKVTGLKYYRSGGSYSSTANNGLGEEWTDAPEATINANNEVDWDLGDLVLENGVTYTVTFVVWPKQSSLDLVADLNNGIISYDSLTVSQKSQIKHIGDKYALKTNTDSPTLTYSTITTTTVDGVPTSVTSDPTTVDIENPDPVNLSEAKLALEKKWEDSLDPTQREEVGGEVTLNLLMDGKPYEIKVGDTLTDKILLTETSDWKIDPGISVAPGLMVAENSVAYDPNAPQVSYGGVTYAILEAGHEYTFEEKGINNHFELTSYIHHPMKIGNAVKDVFFSRDADGNITGIERIEDLDTLSATNTLKGGINVEKKVVDKNGNAVDTDDSFEITVHMIGTDSKPYNYDYRVYYGKKNPEYESHIVYNDDGSVRYSRSDHIYGTGDITETLYIGDVIRIVNVESGVEYYVEEDVKDGYDANPVIVYEEKYGNESTSSSSASTTDGYYVVSGNTASNVTVTNKFLDEKTKVDFEKTWYDEDGNVLSGKTLPGSITVELFKKGADGKVVSTGKTQSATANTNWKASFTDLPKYDNGVAIVYSIKESAIEGATYNEQQKAFFEFDSEENNGKHAVLGRWKVMTLEDYILQNTWTPATESVTGKTSLNIMKVDKTTGEALSGAKFELALKNGATTTVTTDDAGKATFDNLDAGEYTLKETDAPEGYKLISAEPSINITKIKKLNTVDLANLKNFYEYVFSFSTYEVSGYEYDANSRTFTVKDEPIPYDNITAAKVWDDDSDRDGLRKNYADYYIAVKNNEGKYVAYEKLVLENKDDYSFNHLPLKTVNGEDITYEVVEASTCSGKDDAIKCTEFTGDNDYTVTVADGVVTNYHKPELYNVKGELTVQKIWAGEGNDLVRPNTVTIELYANGSRLGEPVTISAANEWKYTFKNLYLNEGGKPIVYTVQESKLGETAFGEDESVIVIVSDDGISEGTWTKSENNDKHEVTNTWNRSAAKSLTIKKTVEGLSADVLSNLEFTITGPEDFGDNGKMTLKASKDCTTANEVITCKVSDKVPTGKYTVKESNAEVENFTMTVTGDDGATKKVAKDDEVEFAITNSYEKIRDVHYKVKKIWDDNDDQDGLRPDKLTITLMRKGSGKAEEYRTVELTDDKLEHEWTNLPRADENAVVYTYSVVEEEISDYESDGGKMVGDTFIFTNKHELELINDEDDDPDNDGKITVQKVWTGEGNELARPNSVTVELYANGMRLGTPVTLTAAGEWKHTFDGLYKNEGGKPIVYSVEESKLGETAFGESQSTIVVYSSDDAISGSWTKSVNGHEITNTWKEATDEIIYDGANRFYIKKVDEEYQPLEGVTFSVNGADKITNAEGITSKSVPVSKNRKEESFEFTISEKATLEGYDLVEGSATVTVTCTSVLAETDASTLTNTYVKNCSFEKSGSDKYVWEDASKTLTVVNNRSLAKSLKIQKTTVGLKAEVLKGLEFTITGPEDFGEEGEMTLRIGEGCKASGYKITCEVDGKVPTGTYTVKENNAEIEGFALTVSGDNGVEKKVDKDDEVVFEIENTYEVDEVMYFVDKIWEDAHDKDGKRPEELVINLLANGEVVDTIVMTMRDAYILGDDFEDDYVTGDIWGYVWDNLPYMDENAELISYTVEEVLESEDYEQVWAGGDEYATTFVNYHELEDDPCAEGGCGGFDVIPTIPTAAPNTGRLSLKNNRNSSAEEAGSIEYTIGTCALVVLGIVIFVAEKKNHVRK